MNRSVPSEAGIRPSQMRKPRFGKLNPSFQSTAAKQVGGPGIKPSQPASGASLVLPPCTQAVVPTTPPCYTLSLVHCLRACRQVQACGRGTKGAAPYIQPPSRGCGTTDLTPGAPRHTPPGADKKEGVGRGRDKSDSGAGPVDRASAARQAPGVGVWEEHGGEAHSACNTPQPGPGYWGLDRRLRGGP